MGFVPWFSISVVHSHDNTNVKILREVTNNQVG